MTENWNDKLPAAHERDRRAGGQLCFGHPHEPQSGRRSIRTSFITPSMKVLLASA